MLVHFLKKGEDAIARTVATVDPTCTQQLNTEVMALARYSKIVE